MLFVFGTTIYLYFTIQADPIKFKSPKFSGKITFILTNNQNLTASKHQEILVDPSIAKGI